MIPFDEIDERLKNMGKDRAWLAEKTRRSFDSIRSALAPNAKPKSRSALLQKALSDAIEREETAYVPKVIPADVLVLSPSASEYQAWSLAHKASDSATLKDWAIDELNKAAAAWKASKSKVIPIAPIASHWIDLCGGIAAGAPISSDASHEAIPAPREYPEDHYALRVFGKSMENKILDGSTIVVKRWQEGYPKKGSIVVYSDGHGSTLKVFGYRDATAEELADDHGNTMGRIPVLSSINKAFPEVTTMDGGRIEAVFVEVI